VAADGLTVAVTGPTGDLGIALVTGLEASAKVRRVVGMARRPFDPASQGWKKTEYRQGDVTDRGSVRDALNGADVVVHLAFSILGEGDRTREINVEGSKNVFEAAIGQGAERLLYASSVAAYGFHDDNPDWLDEDVPPRGTPAHYYSAQKAEVEQMLERLLEDNERTQPYVFRPCIVAGPKAQTLLEEMPYYRLSEAMPDAVVKLLSAMPALKPVLPDPGTRFQLVHEDDVAQAFIKGAVNKSAAPGAYNLAGDGTLTMSDLANAVGWYSIPVPDFAVDAAAQVVRLVPGAPELLSWVNAVRKPVLLKTDRAKKRLRWTPEHTSKGTLKELVDAYRASDDEDERVH
jgi:nucleoside-diphosphate-sugar epimerase